MSDLGLGPPPGLGQGVRKLPVWDKGLHFYCYKSLRPFSVEPDGFGGVRNLPSSDIILPSFKICEMSGKLPVTVICFYLAVLTESGSQCSKITEEQSLMENVKIDNRKRTSLFVKYISTHYGIFAPAYTDVHHVATGRRSRYFEQLGSPGRGLVRR